MERLLQENKQWIETYWANTVEKLRRNSVLLKDKIPLVIIDGVYDDHSNSTQISAWTNGFWPGIMRLMYSATGEKCFMDTARNAEEVLDAALADYKCLHHCQTGFARLLK